MNEYCFCGNCFSEIPPRGALCPNCGFDNAEARRLTGCLLPGSMLGGRYRVGRRLGAGGFGITYKCLDTRIGGVCAIKEYLPSYIARRDGNMPAISVSPENLPKYKEVLAKFMNEAELVKSLNHRNIVKVYDIFYQNNTAYYVMEYCDGMDLKQYTDSFRRRLGYDEGMNILSQVMDGLEYIHSNGVLHRDIAPDNIFVTGSGMVKLLDFGSARREMMQSGGGELTGFIKVGYAPVEQYGGGGKQGPFTDIYALGATFYCLFTGVMPAESTARVESDPLRPISALRPDLPVNLRRCIEKCMTVRVAGRVQTIDEMRKLLGFAKTVPTSPNTQAAPNVSTAPKPVIPDDPRASGKGMRILAFFIDATIWLILATLAMYIQVWLGVLLLVCAVPVEALMENQFGATLGKLMTKLRVVNEEDKYPDFGHAMIRNLVKLVGFFVLIFSEGTRLLDDRLSGTKVLRL